jgi:hypothetical protein
MFNPDLHKSEEHTFVQTFGNPMRVGRKMAAELPGKFITAFSSDEKSVKTWVKIEDYLSVCRYVEPDSTMPTGLQYENESEVKEDSAHD